MRFQFIFIMRIGKEIGLRLTDITSERNGRFSKNALELVVFFSFNLKLNVILNIGMSFLTNCTICNISFKYSRRLTGAAICLANNLLSSLTVFIF